VWARVRVLRSALGWAYAERIVDRHPLDGMRGHRRPGFACTLRSQMSEASSTTPNDRSPRQQPRYPGQSCASRLHRAEQVLLEDLVSGFGLLLLVTLRVRAWYGSAAKVSAGWILGADRQARMVVRGVRRVME
jgi:hypothetical protein